jgi:hypothetical protein
MTANKHRFDGCKTPFHALIAVYTGVYYSRTFLTRCVKNRVKNAEKPAVFSAKTRGKRLLFLTGR